MVQLQVFTCREDEVGRQDPFELSIVTEIIHSGKFDPDHKILVWILFGKCGITRGQFQRMSSISARYATACLDTQSSGSPVGLLSAKCLNNHRYGALIVPKAMFHLKQALGHVEPTGQKSIPLDGEKGSTVAQVLVFEWPLIIPTYWHYTFTTDAHRKGQDSVVCDRNNHVSCEARDIKGARTRGARLHA